MSQGSISNSLKKLAERGRESAILNQQPKVAVTAFKRNTSIKSQTGKNLQKKKTEHYPGGGETNSSGSALELGKIIDDNNSKKDKRNSQYRPTALKIT